MQSKRQKRNSDHPHDRHVPATHSPETSREASRRPSRASPLADGTAVALPLGHPREKSTGAALPHNSPREQRLLVRVKQEEDEQNNDNDKLDDEDLGEEQDAREDQRGKGGEVDAEAHSNRSEIQRLPRPLQAVPIVPGAPLWSTFMPAVYEHYSMYQPDYSGAKMYQVGNDFVGQYAALVQAAPENVSIAALVGETVPQPWRKSFYLPSSLILEVKSSVYRTLNRKLRDPDEVVKPTLSMSILALARYEAFASDSPLPARAHLRGLQHLLASHPTKNLLPHDFLRFALLFCDRSVSLFSGLKPIFPGPVNAFCNPASPFVKALIPSSSDVEPGQWRRIITSFYRTPGAELIGLLSKISDAIDALDKTEPSDPASLAILGIREELSRRSPDIYKGVLTFSDPKFAMQMLVYESMRRTGLLLTSAALNRNHETRNAISESTVDHDAMSLFMLDHSLLVEYSPACGLFVLCVDGPFAIGAVRRTAKALFATAAQRLGLQDWAAVKAYLSENMFYYPHFQDDFGPSFRATQRQQRPPKRKKSEDQASST